MRKLVLRYLYYLLIITLFFAGIGFGIFYYYSQELPPLSELRQYDMKTGSEVYDRHDKLIHTFAVENRKLTNINELQPHTINALIAIEDERFMDHWGVDLKGVLRATLSVIKSRSMSQGASTITQQLARNLFLTLDKKIARKIKEIILAIRIEKNFSKSEILELYFNKVPFGPGIYGIEAAAKKYFNKEAKDLTLLESASIVGITQLPSAYYPIRYPERATRRRNMVLKRMYEIGYITHEQYENLIKQKLELNVPKKDSGSDDYFIEYIRRYLEKKYSTNQLFAEGMKIYTTLDIDLQNYADSILNRELRKFENKNNYEFKYDDFPADTTDIVTPYVQGGVLSIEPLTGYVRVMIGGRNFKHSKFNRMIDARRQPGSAFKPIIYATAVANGYTPATVIKDENVCFIQSDTLFWKIHNYSRKYFGYTRMRDALRKSRNVWAVKMLYDLGIGTVVNSAKNFGITTYIPRIWSLAIGTNAVQPLELVSAYTVFPNNGVLVKPVFIRRVEDAEGNILEQNETERIRVLDEKVGYMMTNLMQSVLEEGGTGYGARWRGYKWTGAGKTGTTDNFNDAWFIGYNRELVTGVWVGFDDNHTLGKGQSGATAALPAWPYIMKKAIELDAPKNSNGKPIIDGSRYEFERPEGLVSRVISKKTGLLPKTSSEETMVELFIEGTEPTPLSDSLEYNFIPTFYRTNDRDSLVFDLGGKPYKWPEVQEFEIVYPDSTDSTKIAYVPKRYPNRIDLRGALIIKDKKIVTRPDSLLYGDLPDTLNYGPRPDSTMNFPRIIYNPAMEDTIQNTFINQDSISVQNEVTDIKLSE